MKLKDLKDAGGVIEARPVKKRVVWTRGNGEPLEFDVHIRRLAYGPLERVMLETGDEQSRGARFLAATVLLGEAGDEPLSYADAYQLDPGLAAELLKAAREVNATGEVPAKN